MQSARYEFLSRSGQRKDLLVGQAQPPSGHVVPLVERLQDLVHHAFAAVEGCAGSHEIAPKMVCGRAHATINTNALTTKTCAAERHGSAALGGSGNSKNCLGGRLTCGEESVLLNAAHRCGKQLERRPILETDIRRLGFTDNFGTLRMVIESDIAALQFDRKLRDHCQYLGQRVVAFIWSAKDQVPKTGGTGVLLHIPPDFFFVLTAAHVAKELANGQHDGRTPYICGAGSVAQWPILVDDVRLISSDLRFRPDIMDTAAIRLSNSWIW
jgi:hypothetical protein